MSEKNTTTGDELLQSSTSSVRIKSKNDLESLHSRIAEAGHGEHGNILAQYSETQVMQMGRNYAQNNGLDADLFSRAAALARAPADFQSSPLFSDEEKDALEYERSKKWNVPVKLFRVLAVGAMGAAVQGMDESVINGATLRYPDFFIAPYKKYDQQLLEGLINGAPYLCASCIACWMSDFWNRHLGRKYTIFWTCFISALTCFWQGFVNTWYHLFIARFCLGFGIGIKSATVPAYAAECAPKHIRGALVMMWQFWTAVGIMFGYVACAAFYYVPSRGITDDLNWRLMLGSACIPAIIVLFQIPFVPESPRWLMGKEKHLEAFEATCELRRANISAARDCFYQYVLLKEERSYQGIPLWKRMSEMFTIRRNRNGALGAWIVMFMQQFCGINAIVYYNSNIFIQAGVKEINAIVASWGFGMINFIFAIPTFFTIDKYGRRQLLLITFPLMALFLLWTALGFIAPVTSKTRLGVVASGIYVYAAIYSAGEGPVPFTYSAEAFPLYIRDLGMGFATATLWFFNFILAFTFPKMLKSMGNTGSFLFYAAWNLVGFFLVLWFLPETKNLTLEELDEVFGVSTWDHAKWQTKHLIFNIQKYILRLNVTPQPPLYIHERLAIQNPWWVEQKTEIEHVE